MEKNIKTIVCGLKESTESLPLRIVDTDTIKLCDQCWKEIVASKEALVEKENFDGEVRLICMKCAIPIIKNSNTTIKLLYNSFEELTADMELRLNRKLSETEIKFLHKLNYYRRIQ